MQAYIAKLSGTPTVGDCVRLTWYGKLGGRTDAGHHVQENYTLQDILVKVAESAKNYFLSDQEAKVRDGSLMIVTSREDGWFDGDVQGVGTEQWTIEKL